MATTLPTRTAITSATTTNAEQKINLGDQRDFIADMLGTDSADKAAARYALGVASELKPIGATVGSSAMTVTVNPLPLDFRSATLTSGAISNVAVPAAISCLVPSGATLGTTNAALAGILVLLINYLGTAEVAVINHAGGFMLDEMGIISTTALSAGSDSDNVAYSTTARTNVPYRIVGYIESTQATAGTWAAAPSKIQGVGGRALSVAEGGPYADMTASRALSTTYRNATPYWKTAYVSTYIPTVATVTVTVNGLALGSPDSATNQALLLTIRIPPWATYQVSWSVGGGVLVRWTEN